MRKTQNRNPREMLIFALDIGGDIGEAISWVECLRDHVGIFKVGKESFTRYGPEVVSKIKEQGGKVFLDLKFHDIPHTVARAAEVAVKMGVTMFDVHALGGKRMMEETVAVAKRTAEQAGLPPPMVLAVTVLTSLSDNDLRKLGFNQRTGEIALNLARVAQEAGVSGVVASARDIPAIRESCGRDFLIVAPGIRGGMEIADDDQERITTPENAIALGADYIVVGRPIRMAGNPIEAAEEIHRAISRGLSLREESRTNPTM
ncbi:MAG: orotidine-5'-phosphate decarboxylase [Syntrophales bacterium]|nr:orotidine-5'-phosphate decarboxylase [Syntrophales bacterium]